MNRFLPGSKASTVAQMALLLAVFAVYGRTIAHGFVNFDDERLITGNPAVRAGLTAESVRWALVTDEDAGRIPLTWLSRLIDVELFGLEAGGHHLVNVLLHAGAVLLLYRFLRKATGRSPESWFVAALFAVHPVHVESVAWVAERKDVLCGFFWMLALESHRRFAERPSAGRYLATAAWVAGAILSKPVAVTLPFVLLLVDVWPLGRLGSAEEEAGTARSAPASARRLVLEKAPLLAMSAAASAATIASEWGTGAMADPFAGGFADRIAAIAASYATYAGKLVFPRGLAVFYPPEDSIPPVRFVVSALLIGGVSAFAVRRIRRRPWIPVGWGWFLGVLVPVIGIVPVGDFRVADRCLYLPAAGFWMASVFGISDVLRGRMSRGVSAAASGAVLVALGSLAFLRVGDWRDSGALFRRALAVTEGNWLAHGNLGHHLERQGRTEEAIAHYREALRIRPGYVDALVNLGVALQRTGRNDEAEKRFREALDLDPRLAVAQNNLGVILAGRGDRDGAAACYREAVRLRPEYAGARNNLGIALLEEGDSRAAESQFRQALRLDAGFADAWNNLGVSLARQGRVSEAKPCFEEAVRFDPGHPDALANLARFGREGADGGNAAGGAP